MKEKVVLDANVLFSNSLRTFFLWLFWNNIIQIVWCGEVWDEVTANFSRKTKKSQQFKNHVADVILKRFPGAMRQLKHDFPKIGLPDPDDEYLVALAIQSKSDRIVTFNLKDFPPRSIGRFGIEVSDPDSFLCALFDANPAMILSTVQQTIASYTESRPSNAAYYQSLRKTNVNQFVDRLEKFGHEIPETWIRI